MTKKISFESLMNVYRNYNISSGRKLREINDPVFLKVSKKLKVKKETIYASLQKHWNRILKSQPMLKLVDCSRPNKVSMKCLLILMVKMKHSKVIKNFENVLDLILIFVMFHAYYNHL